MRSIVVPLELTVRLVADARLSMPIICAMLELRTRYPDNEKSHAEERGDITFRNGAYRHIVQADIIAWGGQHRDSQWRACAVCCEHKTKIVPNISRQRRVMRKRCGCRISTSLNGDWSGAVNSTGYAR